MPDSHTLEPQLSLFGVVPTAPLTPQAAQLVFHAAPTPGVLPAQTVAFSEHQPLHWEPPGTCVGMRS